MKNPKENIDWTIITMRNHHQHYNEVRPDSFLTLLYPLKLFNSSSEFWPSYKSITREKKSNVWIALSMLSMSNGAVVVLARQTTASVRLRRCCTDMGSRCASKIQFWNGNENSTFNVCRKSCWQIFVLAAIVEYSDPDLVFSEDDMGPAASSGDSVATPTGLKTIVLTLYLNVRSFTFHCVWSTQIVECGKQI